MLCTIVVTLSDYIYAIFSHTDFTNKNTLLFVCVAIVLWFNNLIYAKKTLYLRSIKVNVRKFSDSDLTSATGNSLRMKRNKKSRKEPQQLDSLS